MTTVIEQNATAPAAKSDTAPARPRLLDEVRERIRVKHYSYATEKTYTHVLNRGGRGVTSPLDRVTA